MRADDDSTSAIAHAPLARSPHADTPIDDAVLDVPQVASLLGVGRNMIYALVARNGIPHRRLGKTIRFSRAAVMSWLSTSWQVAKEGR